jgi:hypothetical protein
MTSEAFEWLDISIWKRSQRGCGYMEENVLVARTRKDMPFQVLVSRERLPAVRAEDHIDDDRSLPPGRRREVPDVEYNGSRARLTRGGEPWAVQPNMSNQQKGR